MVSLRARVAGASLRYARGFFINNRSDGLTRMIQFREQRRIVQKREPTDDLAGRIWHNRGLKFISYQKDITK